MQQQQQQQQPRPQSQMTLQRMPHPHQHHNFHQMPPPHPKHAALPTSRPQGNLSPRIERSQPPQQRPLQGNVPMSRNSEGNRSETGAPAMIPTPHSHPQSKSMAPPPSKGMMGPKTQVPIPTATQSYARMEKTASSQTTASGEVAQRLTMESSSTNSNLAAQKQKYMPSQGRLGEVKDSHMPGAGRMDNHTSMMQRQQMLTSAPRDIPPEQQIRRNSPRAQVPQLPLKDSLQQSQPRYPSQMKQGQEHNHPSTPQQRPVQYDPQQSTLQRQQQVVAEPSVSRNPHQVRFAKTPSPRAMPSLPQSQPLTAKRGGSPPPIAEPSPPPLQLAPNVRLRDDLADAGVAPSTSVRAAQDGKAVEQLLPSKTSLRRFSEFIHRDSDEDSSDPEEGAAAGAKVEKADLMPLHQSLATKSETQAVLPELPPLHFASKPSQEKQGLSLGAALASPLFEKEDEEEDDDDSGDNDDEAGKTSNAREHEGLLNKPLQPQPLPSSLAPMDSATPEGEASANAAKASPKRTNGNHTHKIISPEEDSVGTDALTRAAAAAPPVVGEKVKAETQKMNSDITPHRRVQKGEKRDSQKMAEDEEYLKREKYQTRGEDSAARKLHDTPSRRKESRHAEKNVKKRETERARSASLPSLSASLSPSDSPSRSSNVYKNGNGSNRMSENKKKESKSASSTSRSPSRRTNTPKGHERHSQKDLSLPQRLHNDRHKRHHHHHRRRDGSDSENGDVSRQPKTPLRSRHAHRSARVPHVSSSPSDSQIFRTSDVYTLYRELCRQQAKYQRGRSSPAHSLHDSRSTGHVPWRHASLRTASPPPPPPLCRPFGYIPKSNTHTKPVSPRETVLPVWSESPERVLFSSHPYEVPTPMPVVENPNALFQHCPRSKAAPSLRRMHSLPGPVSRERSTGIPAPRCRSAATSSRISSPAPQIRPLFRSPRRCCSEPDGTATTASLLNDVLPASCRIEISSRVPIPVVDMRRDFRPHVEDSTVSRSRRARSVSHGAAPAWTPSPMRCKRTPLRARALSESPTPPVRTACPLSVPPAAHKARESTRPSAWAVAPGREELPLAGSPVLQRRVGRAPRSARGKGDRRLVEEVRLDEQRRPYVLIKEVPHGTAARESQRASVQRLSKPRTVFMHSDAEM